MLSKETADIQEVANATGKSPTWLKRNWLKFNEEHGFPRPIPGGGWMWPRRAVELWLIAGGVIMRSANSNEPGVDLISLQRQAHHERYGVVS